MAEIAPIGPALITAASALVVAVITALVAYLRYLHEQTQQQETLLNALFGEMANIYEHYSYAMDELPKDPSDKKKVRIRLQFSIYGSLDSATDVSRYGFLNATDIRLLLQLQLRIRNNDNFVAFLLEDPATVASDDLLAAARRMKYAMDTAAQLVHRLADKRPRLRKELQLIGKDLPPIMKSV